MPATVSDPIDVAAEPSSPASDPVELLVAPRPELDFDANLERLASTRCLPPFAAEAQAFMKDVSRTILRDRSMAAHPELMAMAHSLRPAQVVELERQFEDRNSGRVRRGVGLAFHIAPANVDTLFAYSWFLSLLSGNPNLVRVSGRRGEAVQRLVEILAGILEKPEHAAVRERSLVVSYGRADAVTTAISSRCRLRIIWGGDATVDHLRSLPLESRAREIAFADRFSLAALSATAVNRASSDELATLAKSFVNDAFWFDQNACSSPRAIYWLGTEDEAEGARERLWPLVEGHLRANDWRLPPAAMVARMTAVQSLAARGVVQRVQGEVNARGILRLTAGKLDETARTGHPAGGVFYEYVIESLDELDEILSPRDQTMTVWGIARRDLESWIAGRHGVGVDRIVPVGRALDFDSVWDGQDLFDVFTDEVTLST